MKVHPYLADLPIFDAEVDALAEAIQEVGLLHPITLDAEGQIIGGRHRLAACQKVNVEPDFETYDGDALAFILHDNATRKHQSTGQRAAEMALSLDAAGRRDNGRWKRGTVGDIQESLNSGAGQWRNAVSECGLILDHLGRDALVAVAKGDRTLNDAYVEAEQARDAEANRRAREAAEAQEEAEAEAFVNEHAPDLADRVNGTDLLTYREALDLWTRRNREEAERLAKEKAEQDRKEAERRAGIKRDANRLLNFLDGIAAASLMADHPYRGEVLDELDPIRRKQFLTIEKDITWPTTV